MLHSAVRLPGRHWARRGVRPPTVSAEANCDGPTVRTCLRSATLSPLARPRGRLRTASAQANRVRPSTPAVYDSLTPRRRAAGPRGRAPTVSAKGLQRIQCCFVGPFLFLFPLIDWFFSKALDALHVVGTFNFQPCAGFASRTPASPSVGRRRLSSCLFLSLSLFLPSRSGRRPVAARRAGPACGGDVTTGDVTSPPGVPPGPPAQEPSC